MKKIENYMHLYLGCECIIGDLNWKRPVISPQDIAPFVDLDYGKPIKTKLDCHVIQQFLHKTTLILRPLSDMSEEEDKEISALWFELKEKEQPGTTGIEVYGVMVKWYLDRHFDLFGLIEAGLAIDKTTLKQTGEI